MMFWVVGLGWVMRMVWCVLSFLGMGVFLLLVGVSLLVWFCWFVVDHSIGGGGGYCFRALFVVLVSGCWEYE